MAASDPENANRQKLSDKEQVLALKAKMLSKSFFVMQRRIVDPTRIEGVLLDHYKWIISLEKEGAIFASGPLSRREGGPGIGMTIFRATSWEEAELIAAKDPFCTGGAMTFEIFSWQLNEGRITLEVDLSDQTVRLG